MELLQNVWLLISIPLYAIIADTFVGVFIALIKGNFDITYFPQFLAKNILPYVGSLIILAFLAKVTGDTNMYYLFGICVTAVTAKFSWEMIFQKFIGAFNGVYEAKVS